MVDVVPLGFAPLPYVRDVVSVVLFFCVGAAGQSLAHASKHDDVARARCPDSNKEITKPYQSMAFLENGVQMSTTRHCGN